MKRGTAVWSYPQRLIATILTIVWVCAYLPLSHAQGSKGPVSQDLLDLYESTRQASEEEQFTQLIEQTAKVVRDSGRSAADQEYAKQLLSWAANKRGEWRSDQAGLLVEKKEFDQAKKLDQWALADFQLALANDPKRWRAHHNLGISLALQNKKSLAIEEFSKAIELNPKYLNTYFNRAEIFKEMQDHESAIADYSSVLQLNPKDGEALSARAKVYLRIDRIEEALADFLRASQLEPQNIDRLLDYADACQTVGRWREGTIAYRDVLSKDEDNLRCIQNVSWLMATCPEGKYRNAQLAVEFMEKAKKSTEQWDYQLWDVLAAAQAASGNYVAAIQSATRASREAPDSERSEIEARLNLYRKSRAYLQPATIASSDRTLNKQAVKRPVGTGVR